MNWTLMCAFYKWQFIQMDKTYSTKLKTLPVKERTVGTHWLCHLVAFQLISNTIHPQDQRLVPMGIRVNAYFNCNSISYMKASQSF